MARLTTPRNISFAFVVKCFLPFFLFVIPFSAWGQAPQVKPEQIITLVFSSNIYGEYEPCG